jgi:hypothetical protein
MRSQNRPPPARTSGYWADRSTASLAGEFARTLAAVRAADPERFLARPTSAPVSFQCGRFDTPDAKRGCEEAYKVTPGPKVLRWYDGEHGFTDVEASLDRLIWIAERTGLSAQPAVLNEAITRRPPAR